MSEEKVDSKSNLIADLIARDVEKKKEKKDRLEMTFEEYLERVEQNPDIAQFSKARIFSMVLGRGVHEMSEADIDFYGTANEWPFFSEHLKGVNGAIASIMEYFKAGSENLALGKKILLLVGPPSSGKSTIVEILKRGLESYNKLPIFRIKGCTLNEEPLHLIPDNMREEYQKRLGIKIKGDLCPRCKALLKEYIKEHGEVGYYKIPVEQFHISSRNKDGIGRFEPADEKSQDISDITAQPNPAVMFNSASLFDHPEAYLFTGAIPRGNRGIVEAVEFLKKGIDEKILYAFISLNEEGIMAIPGSSLKPIDIDTSVIGHCNLVGYKHYASNTGNEGVHSRIHVVKVPYALRIKEEVSIYKKMIGESTANAHIAPGTLELVALFAVATRLNEDQSLGDVIDKARFVDGRAVDSVNDKNIDIRAVLKRGQQNDDWVKRDGMFGISYRDVMSALSLALVSDEGCKCLTPKKAMAFLLANFENMVGTTPDTLKQWRELLNNNITEAYKENVIETINTAFLASYGPLALKKALKYFEDVEKHCMRKIKMASTRRNDASSEPDYKAMEKIENLMGYTSKETREVARSEFLMLYLQLLRMHNNKFELEELPALRNAVNKVLLGEMAVNMVAILKLSDEVAGKEADETRQRRKDLLSGLEALGYCKHCAKEILEEASKYIN